MFYKCFRCSLIPIFYLHSQNWLSILWCPDTAWIWQRHHRYDREMDFMQKNKLSDMDMQVPNTDTLPTLKCPCNIGASDHAILGLSHECFPNPSINPQERPPNGSEAGTLHLCVRFCWDTFWVLTPCIVEHGTHLGLLSTHSPLTPTKPL